MLNVHITAFISAGRSSAAGTIFPPSSKLMLRMRIPSTGTRAFQTDRVFHLVVVCFRPWVFYHGGLVLSVWSRSRRGKIGVKSVCQFAKYIWNFYEKGECGALAMILLNRLSQLGSPDVL